MTVPLSWLRALSFMLSSIGWVGGDATRRAGRGRRAQALAARVDHGVGGGVVLGVPAAAEVVEPAAARRVAGHVEVGLERLDVQHRGAVEQVDAGVVDLVAADGHDPDQAEGEVVGADGDAGETPDPLAGVLEQERDRPGRSPVKGRVPRPSASQARSGSRSGGRSRTPLQPSGAAAYCSRTTSQPGSSGLRWVWIGVPSRRRWAVRTCPIGQRLDRSSDQACSRWHEQLLRVRRDRR